MIDLLSALLTSNSAITSASNALWGGTGLLMAGGCHYLVVYKHHELPEFVIECFKWGRLPGLCVAAHRAWWNVGLVFAPQGVSYHPLIIEYRHFTLLFVIGIVFGTMKATLPLIHESVRNKVAGYAIAFLFSSAFLAGVLAL